MNKKSLRSAAIDKCAYICETKCTFYLILRLTIRLRSKHKSFDSINEIVNILNFLTFVTSSFSSYFKIHNRLLRDFLFLHWFKKYTYTVFCSRNDVRSRGSILYHTREKPESGHPGLFRRTVRIPVH